MLNEVNIGLVLIISSILALLVWHKIYGDKLRIIAMEKKREFYKKHLLGGEVCVNMYNELFTCKLRVTYGTKVHHLTGSILFTDNQILPEISFMKQELPDAVKEMAMDELKIMGQNILETKLRSE